MTLTPQSPWPFFGQDEIDAAAAVLKSGKVNYWTGSECRLFEEEFARHANCNHAISLANGTLALELALHAIRIQPGNEVIVPAKTFIATASAVVRMGAIPIVADVELESQGISLDSIRQLTTPKTKAIIPVHLAGWPCDMDAIMAFAKERNIYVIEDCAQAHGAHYKGRPVGSLGHMAAFSFCQDKIMTTGGEGGMLTTNDAELWKRAWEFKDHGKNHDKIVSPEKQVGFRWLHDTFGTNFRLTEMQSAIGRVQLSKLDAWKKKRQENAAFLTESLRDISGIVVHQPPEWIDHAYYKFYAFLKDNTQQESVLLKLRNADIQCFSGSCSEIYREEAFKLFPSTYQHELPNANLLSRTSLMFPVHPTITQAELEKVALTLHDTLHELS